MLAAALAIWLAGLVYTAVLSHFNSSILTTFALVLAGILLAFSPRAPGWSAVTLRPATVAVWLAWSAVTLAAFLASGYNAWIATASAVLFGGLALAWRRRAR